MGALIPYLADALVVLGVFVMTIGVYGMIRMPDTYTRLHATSKAVFLGVIVLLIASTATGDPAIVLRAVLIGVFLILTTPVSAHVVARAAFKREEHMKSSPAVDQSGHALNRGSGGERR